MQFESLGTAEGVDDADWGNWNWQIRRSLKTVGDFQAQFELSESERAGFLIDGFRVQATPYYARLAQRSQAVRKIVIPTALESDPSGQHLFDPLGERVNQPVTRIIHRYADRALFLVTDMCGIYCRYCTRKHFTGGEKNLIGQQEYIKALEYLRGTPSIREVILSGGDPLTLGDTQLERIMTDLRAISHIEIIRVGSRLPAATPMRITDEFVKMVRRFSPVFFMVHFNHPQELTEEAATALGKLVDAGIPVFNQMVLLNGINNHPNIVKALSRRLLYLRVKPYYMFQCDPSRGTEHLRTSIENSEMIQSALWGHMSGLAMPNCSLDIPEGGGKISIVPNFEVSRSEAGRTYRGFDGVEAEYQKPMHPDILPPDFNQYAEE